MEDLLFEIQFVMSEIQVSLWQEKNYEKIERMCTRIKEVFDGKKINEYMKEKQVDAEFDVLMDYTPSAPVLICLNIC